jgi:hypothetical protein
MFKRRSEPTPTDILKLKHDPNAFYTCKLQEANQYVAESKANTPDITDNDMLKNMYNEEDLAYMIKRKTGRTMTLEVEQSDSVESIKRFSSSFERWIVNKHQVLY